MTPLSYTTMIDAPAYIVTSKPGMTPYSTVATRDEAERDARAARESGLYGHIFPVVVSIKALADAMDADAYHASNGSYVSMPAWGPRTERVDALVKTSGPDADIVSWDTRSTDVGEHVYLMRRMVDGRTRFEIVSEAELIGR